MILKNKVILVTGGASGIGKEIVCKCLNEGASVLIVDINKEAGEKTVKEFVPFGKVCFVKTDLTCEDDIKKSIEYCINTYDKLDVVINNARPVLKEFKFENCFNEWDLGLNILVKAPALYAKYAFPHLKKSKNGLILNISSTNAKFVSHQPCTYHIAKAALDQLTKYLANNYAQHGIRVNGIAPGLVAVKNKNNKTDKESLYNSIANNVVPLQRFADIQEVSNSVIALCSDYFTYLNGETITLDGGTSTFDHFHSCYKMIEANLIKEIDEKN